MSGIVCVVIELHFCSFPASIFVKLSFDLKSESLFKPKCSLFKLNRFIAKSICSRLYEAEKSFFESFFRISAEIWIQESFVQWTFILGKSCLLRTPRDKYASFDASLLIWDLLANRQRNSDFVILTEEFFCHTNFTNQSSFTPDCCF